MGTNRISDQSPRTYVVFTMTNMCLPDDDYTALHNTDFYIHPLNLNVKLESLFF